MFRFEGLEIFQMARAFATKVYTASAKYSRKEEYGVTSQINRAVNSISLNIAEGSAKKINKAFDYQLETAVGSAFEVVAASFLSVDRQYISSEEQSAIYVEAEQLCKKINAFRNTLKRDD